MQFLELEQRLMAATVTDAVTSQEEQVNFIAKEVLRAKQRGNRPMLQAHLKHELLAKVRQ